MANIFTLNFDKCPVRANVIGPTNVGKSTLISGLVNMGVFMTSQASDPNPCTIFSSELYCSSESGVVKVYLRIKEKSKVLREVKFELNDVLKDSLEAYAQGHRLKKKGSDKRRQFKNQFLKAMSKRGSLSLQRFFSKKSTEDLFGGINFSEIVDHLMSLDDINLREIETTRLIEEFFENDFIKPLEDMYDSWISKIDSVYQIENNGYVEYPDTGKFETVSIYSNENLDQLWSYIYSVESSCALLIESAYIMAPAVNESLYDMVFIDNGGSTQDSKTSDYIHERVSKSYKDCFVLIGECVASGTEFERLMFDLKNYGFEDRVFCILNKYDLYRNTILEDTAKILNYIVSNMDQFTDEINEFGGFQAFVSSTEAKNKYIKSFGNISEELVRNTALKTGVPKENIIITRQLNDVDFITGENIKGEASKTGFMNILSKIRKLSEEIGQLIIFENSSVSQPFKLEFGDNQLVTDEIINEVYRVHSDICIKNWEDILDCNLNPRKYGNPSDLPFWWPSKDSFRNCRVNGYKGYSHQTNAKLYANFPRRVDFSFRQSDQINHYIDQFVNEVKVVLSEGVLTKDLDLLKTVSKDMVKYGLLRRFEKGFLVDVSQGRFSSYEPNNCLESERDFKLEDYRKAIDIAMKDIIDDIIQYKCKTY